ncbi:MAG: hypothetical protein IKF91_03935 [Bacilli bacterium]|nr:hypothetical protein [Bacilli bacterium]
MIDIHSHLLYGIDDGSKSIEDSVDIIEELSKVGYTDIILTPHYISHTKYNSPRDNNLILLNNLRSLLSDRNIEVNLYLGNEIYINHHIGDLLDDGKISSLNDSKYLLIELPMNGEYDYMDVFEDLIYDGYKVILAHPERYHAFQRDFDKIYELEEIGVYFQCNIESILGSYGRSAIKMVKRMFKEKKVSFLATDIHHKKKDYGKFDKAKKKIGKYLSSSEIDDLLIKNPSKIIN